MTINIKLFKFIALSILLILFSTASFAEMYRLECKIRAFDLKDTSFGDKARLFNKVMNFDVDTDRGIYSPDLREESDEVIIHGLWPDAKLSGTLGNQELAWNNELKINDKTLYKYSSYLKKKGSRDKINERKLNITIKEFQIDQSGNVGNKLITSFKFEFKCIKIPLEI